MMETSKRIKIPHRFCNSKGEDDKKPIFESLGCSVKEHSQGILVNDFFVVSLASNRWRAIDKAKWFPYKNIKILVDKTISKPFRSIRDADITKAIIKRFGWVKFEHLHYMKDNVVVKIGLDEWDHPKWFFAEAGGELSAQLITVGELMDFYKKHTGKDLVFPDFIYVRGYIERHGNSN